MLYPPWCKMFPVIRSLLSVICRHRETKCSLLSLSSALLTARCRQMALTLSPSFHIALPGYCYCTESSEIDNLL